MNKIWLIIEKIVGVLLCVWGIIAVDGVTTTIANMINNGYAAVMHTTYFQLFLYNHLNILLSLASLFGGCMLIFSDKNGWLLSVVCTALYVVTFFISSRVNSIDNTKPYYAFSKSYSLMALLFLIILILLIQKSFIKKYNVTAKNWLWAVVIVIALILDKIFLA